MSTDESHDKNRTDPLLHSTEVREAVRHHLEANKNPLKSWFKPRNIAEQVDASARQIGKALTCMADDEDCLLVVERRSSTYGHAYRVQVDNG